MSEQPRFRTFVIQLLLAGAVAMLAIGIFNRIVDPFWYYRDVSVDGVNADKPLFFRFERHVKPALLIRERPQAITVGSSLSEVGFDPLNQAFTDHGRLRGYNFAVAGGHWRITQCYFDYALANAPIRRAVVEVRPPMNLPESECVGEEAGLDIATVGDLLFSVRALRASVQTIQEQGKVFGRHTPEGQYFFARNVPGVELRFRDQLRQMLKERRCDPRVFSGIPGLQHSVPAEGDATKLDLSGLRKVVDAARRGGVELRIVVHPKHAYVYELDARCGEAGNTWEALREMAQVVRDASGDDERIQLWAFMGYNEVNAERVREGMKFWQDPLHLNYETGDLMFEAMFGHPGQSMPEFGFKLTPDNIDDYRRQFEAGRRAFIEANPWFYSGLQALLSPGSGG